jgi:hypothetical protein
MLRSRLTHVLKLMKLYFFSFPIFFSGRRKPRILKCSDCTTSWTIRCSNPCGHEKVSSSPYRPDRHLDPPSGLFNEDVSYFRRVMRTGRDDVHSPPFWAEFKNGRKCASTSLVGLDGIDRDNFSFSHSVSIFF